MNCYVYLLSCRGGALYCGWTNDMPARLAAHKAGRGAKYTRSHAPVELAYLELCPDKSAALRREIEIKRLAHREKTALIARHAERTQELWRQAQEQSGHAGRTRQQDKSQEEESRPVNPPEEMDGSSKSGGAQKSGHCV